MEYPYFIEWAIVCKSKATQFGCYIVQAALYLLQHTETRTELKEKSITAKKGQRLRHESIFIAGLRGQRELSQQTKGPFSACPSFFILGETALSINADVSLGPSGDYWWKRREQRDKINLQVYKPLELANLRTATSQWPDV